MNGVAERGPRPSGLASRMRSLASIGIAAIGVATIALGSVPASGQTPERTLAAGSGDRAITLIQQADGSSATISGTFGSAAVTLPPSTAVSGLVAVADRWYVAGVTTGEGAPRLTAVRGTASKVAPLTAPATDSALVQAPVWAADARSARALVWLEGDRHDALAVRAARFDGERFADPETVAAPGPGTQIAVTAAALDDGSTLVAWAAFDGDDDEILWSRSRTQGWSPPARVSADNRFPDITPSLSAVPDGALLAWSAYDGNDYRLTVARFADGGWSEPRTVGERGSVLPTFAGTTALPLIVYKTAMPRTWSVLAVDSAGRPRARASVPLGTNHRPLVAEDGADDRVVLRWPAVADRVPPARLVLSPVAADR